MNIYHLRPSVEELLIFKPKIFRLNSPADKQAFDELIANGKVSFLHDEIYGQLQELIKGLNPSIKIKADEYPARITNHLQGQDINEYGIWAYYPWNKRLVHLLDEDEFVEVRTNRNQFKITKQEQQLLRTKKNWYRRLVCGTIHCFNYGYGKNMR